MSTIKVWDPVVRIFHWTLVAAFTFSYLTGEEESSLHTYSGYFILGLLVARMVWGFIGTRHARFSDFLYTPVAALGYLRDLVTGKPVKRYLGHSPAGGLMVFALLVSLLMTGFSGLKLEAAEGRGPLAADAGLIISTARADDDDHGENEDGAEEAWEEIHEFFANFTVLLVGLHIGGVLLASVRHRENLARAMWTGLKEQK